MVGKTNSYYNKEYYNITTTIPDDFQVVEYIESDGLSYIDTELLAHSNMKCEVVFSFNELPNDGCLIGCRYNRVSNSRLYFYHYFQGNKLGYGNYFGNGNISVDTIYTIKSKLEQNEQFLIINNEKTIENNIIDYINTHNTFHIFGMNIGDEGNQLTVKAKIYSCKIWNENIIAKYFIPVYNKKTNEIGLYDIVAQKFHINMGSGTFNKGNDTFLSTINIDCDF